MVVSLLVGVLVVVAISGIVFLSVVPLPSVAGCNVAVQVTSTEVSFIVGTYFQINGITGTVTGPATLLDWGAWLSVAPPAVVGSFTMAVTVGTHTSTLSGVQIFPSVPFVNGGSLQATNTLNVGQVPQGPQGISVTLSQNGQQVASGTGSMTVGC